MSISRSPRRNELILRTEERADAKRTAAIIGGMMVVAALMFVAVVTLAVHQ